MAGERSAGNEIGKNGLVEPALTGVENGFDIDGGLGQFHRYGEIANSQASTDRFREGAEINHACRIIESRQCRQWRPIETEVTVIIVFNDICADTVRPFQEFYPPFGGKRFAGRKLV